MIAASAGIDQARLATAIAFDQATTGGVIDRLEARGLVRREIVKTDRRARRRYLEAAGEAAVKVARPIVRHAQTFMLKGLSQKEMTTLPRPLSKAVQSVDTR